MKTNKIVFWVATGLLSAMMLMSSIYMYIINHDSTTVVFGDLGFPAWIVYPLAVAKILGVIAITTRKSEKLKEWAYAGFFFDFLLAIGAHLAVADGGHWAAVVALILLIVSYIFGDKMAKETQI